VCEKRGRKIYSSVHRETTKNVVGMYVCNSIKM